MLIPVRYLSFLDLRHYRPSFLRRDFLASSTVVFLDIPQGVAYAIIAGLPPAMGLYAAAVPAVVGALFRSSRYVVTGPTNALSLLVGSAVAAEVARGGATPVEVGVALAFMVGAMQFLAGLLRLDRAIYLGVGISLVLFLRRARLLTIREMIIGEKGRFREIDPEAGEVGRSCLAIRIMNLTGPLFFAVAGELEAALDSLVRNLAVRVLILRLRQAQDIDVTIASILEATAQKLASQSRTLILLGLRRPALALFEQTGVTERIGQENLFPAQVGWFTAMEAALQRALALTGEHACGKQCPLAEYLAAQEVLRSAAEISTTG